jgi:hypothetical protein
MGPGGTPSQDPDRLTRIADHKITQVATAKRRPCGSLPIPAFRVIRLSPIATGRSIWIDVGFVPNSDHKAPSLDDLVGGGDKFGPERKPDGVGSA